MRILYHLTAPPPVLAGTDAVLQEVDLLRSRFGGDRMFLLPSGRPRERFPRPLYGLHRLPSLLMRDREVELHHVYNSELYYFPVLRLLKKPVVYTVVSGLGPDDRIPSTDKLRGLRRIVVPSRSDLGRLAERGLTNGQFINPGIDLSRFTYRPIDVGSELVLMAGSAPWTRDQFRTKGIDALLSVAKQMPTLRLIFLWRGVLSEEIHERVNALRIDERVEVVSERVDVDPVLGRVHAAMVLAAYPRLVKAFPHSLLEALACGRPILVSDCIPMAEYVRETGCGKVVAGLDESELGQAIDELRGSYQAYQAKALQVGRRDFNQEDLLTAYRRLYEAVLTSQP